MERPETVKIVLDGNGEAANETFQKKQYITGY